MEQFTIKPSDVFIYGKDEIELPDGYTARIKSDYDDIGTPWEWCDGHGPVSEWTSRAKKPGELILCGDRSSHRYYDFAAAVKQARAEGWDTAPYGQGTKGERAHRAAVADFNYLRAWCNDQWHYLCISIELIRDGETVAEDSCCGIETWKDHHREHAAEQLTYMINAHRKERLQNACAAHRERAERKYWACRDVITA